MRARDIVVGACGGTLSGAIFAALIGIAPTSDHLILIIITALSSTLVTWLHMQDSWPRVSS